MKMSDDDRDDGEGSETCAGRCLEPRRCSIPSLPSRLLPPTVREPDLRHGGSNTAPIPDTSDVFHCLFHPARFDRIMYSNVLEEKDEKADKAIL